MKRHSHRPIKLRIFHLLKVDPLVAILECEKDPKVYYYIQ